MESHEVLKKILQKTTPKAIASELGVSLSLVYKWAEPPTAFNAGNKNPLARLLQIIELTEDHSILDWLCRKRGGHFVQDPDVTRQRIPDLTPATQEIIGHFANMLSEISRAAHDQSVTTQEAKEIREVWDKLKSYAEGFVRSCENGDFEEMSQLAAQSPFRKN